MLRYAAATAAVLCCATTTPVSAEPATGAAAERPGGAVAEPVVSGVAELATPPSHSRGRRPQRAPEPTPQAERPSRAAAAPGAPAPRAGQPQRHGRAQQQIGLILTRVSPKAAGPASRVELTGTVENRSSQPAAGLSMRLRYGNRPLSSRAELERFASGAAPALPNATTGQPLPLAATAGGKQGWRLQSTTRAMGMRSFGVYPVTVEVLDGLGQPVATQTTFVTLAQSRGSALKRTSIAWVWPMIDRPHRSSDNIFVDDRLETDLSASGRLGELVAAAKNAKAPLTWAIDPALLDDARAMTAEDGYETRSAKGREPAHKKASSTAAAWLAELRNVAGKSPYFATPYADVDGVALTRNRMSAHLKTAYRDMSGISAKDMMGRPPTSTTGWPVAGAADQRTLDRMAAYGSGTFLMSSALLPARNQNITADATTTLQTSSGVKRTVVYDAGLSEIVSRDTRAPGAAVLTEQRFLAETAMITGELPNQSRTIVVAPSRRWNPAPGLARELLDFTASAPWLSEVSLDKIMRARPQARTFIGYQPEYQRFELGSAYLREVRKIATRGASFGSVLNPPGTPYQHAVLRTESSAWRGQSTQARKTREAVSAELAAESSKVKVVASKRYSIAGSSGRLLITVANDLPDRSVDVQINVSSSKPALLRIADRPPDRFPKRLTIEPKKKQTLIVPVQFSANGDASIDLELLTPDGRQFGTVRTVEVRTTAYGKIAVLITGGALAVLFVGVGVRANRARRRRRTQETGRMAGPAEGTTQGPITGLPGDMTGRPPPGGGAEATAGGPARTTGAEDSGDGSPAG